MKHFRSILYLIGLILFPLVVIILAINPVVRWIAIVVGLLNTLVYIRELYKNYHESRCDGVIEIWEEDIKMIHQVEILIPPEQLSRQSRVVFQVKKVRLTAPDERVSSE